MLAVRYILERLDFFRGLVVYPFDQNALRCSDEVEVELRDEEDVVDASLAAHNGSSLVNGFVVVEESDPALCGRQKEAVLIF